MAWLYCPAIQLSAGHFCRVRVWVLATPSPGTAIKNGRPLNASARRFARNVALIVVVAAIRMFEERARLATFRASEAPRIDPEQCGWQKLLADMED
jgi:hypothetical protein